MNANIKTTLSFLALLITVTSLLLTQAVLDLSKESEKLKQIEHDRYLMFERANELRQSSDDLTRYARLYANTNGEKYKEIYFQIIDVRNGDAKRPLHYASMYWGISEPTRSQRHPLGPPSSLKAEMQKLPYLPYEFARLKESEFNSNELVKLEVEAFNAMDGVFKDGNGNYTVRKEANHLLASELLTSEQYRNAKEKIMLPIDDFLHSLIDRTKKAASLQNKLIGSAFLKIFIFLGCGILILIYTTFFIRKRVILPIKSLTNSISAFKRGDNVIKTVVNYDDEIGVMTTQFFEMKDDLDAELLRTKELAITDPLTGINNRRHFYEVGEAILKLSHRSKDPLSILMLDIDHFKSVNDNYGHVIGDDILIHFSNKIRSQIRESDILARYGGEEFVVLLPKTNIDGAVEIAEKVRKHIEECPFSGGKLSVPVTVSIGVAEVKGERLMRVLTQRVDEALYEAKENGRNRVAVK